MLRRLGVAFVVVLIGFLLLRAQTPGGPSQSNFPVLASANTFTGLNTFSAGLNATAIGAVPGTGAFTTLAASGQITSTLSTGTAPLAITSTTPVTNLTVANHTRMQFCGTTVACSHTALTGSQVVIGSAPLSSGSPSTAVITGISPAFSSNTSYTCLASDVTSITSNVVAVTYTSGSSFTITGPATVTDTVEYICAGN